MAQANHTPIQLYHSTTALAVPSAGDMVTGELALNVADGKLYYKDALGGVALLTAATAVGTVTDVSVVSANGLAGSVANSTSTPAITLSTNVNGMVKADGTGFSAATAGVDYAPPSAGTDILYGDGAGGFSNVGIGSGIDFTAGILSATGTGGTVTDVSVTSANGFAGSVATSTSTPAITISTSVTGIIKGNGTAISAATSGVDYAPATSGTAILKGNGAGGFSNASAGTDYAPPTSGVSILYGNGSGGFSNVTINPSLTFSGGTLSVTPPTSGTSILKGNGLGGFANATAGTDYAPATSGTSILFGNGFGGFSNLTIGSGLSFVSGTLSGTGGTVTDVSVVSANGFGGSVANSTTTPAITLTTSVTGLLKGNGTAVSAASAGTDYVVPSGSITGSAGSLSTTNWTVVESGGKLYFKYGGVDKASLDSSGNFIVVGNVTANGTP